MTGTPPSELVDVRQAAAETGRTAETVRRWIWSGRLRARKEGRRLLIARGDLDSLTRAGQVQAIDLATWIAERDATRPPGSARHGRTAADLVIEDRRRRSMAASGNAGR